MSVSPELLESDRPKRAIRSTVRPRRVILIVSGAVLAVAIVVMLAILAVSTASDEELSVLVGALDSNRLFGLALTAALMSITAGLCAIPVAGRWLLLLVPVRLAAAVVTCLAAFAVWLTSSATVVPLLSGGCETGYVVQEESFLLRGSGTVLRQDGLLVAAVAQTSGDDGYHPFSDGAYDVVEDGQTLGVWYNTSSEYSPGQVSTVGEPAFVLPKLARVGLACGLGTGAREPIPTPSAAPVYTLAGVEAGVREMAAVSFASALAPIQTRTGAAPDAQTLSLVETPCGDGGTRVGVELEFSTPDNEGSLVRILDAWDDAGYAPDRAMQSDLRYSESLPVQTMSARDSSSIDGLIRMEITSQCAAG